MTETEPTKPERNRSMGTCAFCGRQYSRVGMARHLPSCKQRQDLPGGDTVFHIAIEGRYEYDYWLHVEASGNTTLGDLDFLLRRIWVECCDHLSAFSTGRWPRRELSMRTPFKNLLRPGMQFIYEYDFGSTTRLDVKVIGSREGKLKSPIEILARNDPPDIECVECGQPAARVCVACYAEGSTWLCDACAESHECGEEFLLPNVNSPRVGVCGYTGMP